jgi:plasmid maintenance system antidote protein VapI
MHNPAHSDEIIQEYMEGLGLTVSVLAAHLKITRANLSHGCPPSPRLCFCG